MGFGSFLKDFTIGGQAASSGTGQEILGSGAAGVGGVALGQALADREAQGLSPATQEQLTAANVFGKLTPEQQKDLLINNPNIVTSQGKQFFDPLTNTIRLEESEFQTGQRGRQEQLAQELSGQLTGQTLPGTDPTSRFESGRELLAPQFQEDRERLEQQLADQGIPRGSEAFEKELNRLERSQGTQLSALARESVATSEAQRAARFNEISSLLGQQQVGGVGFSGFQPGFQGVDVSGQALSRDLQNQQLAFQGLQAQKDRSAAQRQALISAVGGMGSSGITAAFSDRTLKENIEKVGESENGLLIYHFDYKDKGLGQFRYEGVMAQDLEESNPDAVLLTEDGTLMVDYSKIDVDFRRVN